tara:strand:- start:81151 stop:82224 length:1074 start_codon:yes stop_codon:yes gene_type:complete
MKKAPAKFNSLTIYLSFLTATVLLLLLFTFTFNALVDPLWYFRGNRLGETNFAFNERLSKANLINGHEADFDCVIFGDSRTTLLPEQKINGYRCFNFAFSAGAVNEYVAYAEWLKARGMSPKLVIVGVSAGDFRPRKAPRNVPDFIDADKSPPLATLQYLSLDVTAMSLRTLFGKTPIDRLYDKNFRCKVAVINAYNPAKPIRDIYAGPFHQRAPLDAFQKLKAIFPSAKFVGYAPPLSAYAIAEYQRILWLSSYTRALHDVSFLFDRFLDTSVPSAMTIDPENTYDGTHYSSEVNAKIAEILVKGSGPFALDIKKLSAEEMLSVYKQRLSIYSNELAKRVGEQVDEPGPEQAPHVQ